MTAGAPSPGEFERSRARLGVGTCKNNVTLGLLPAAETLPSAVRQGFVLDARLNVGRSTGRPIGTVGPPLLREPRGRIPRGCIACELQCSTAVIRSRVGGLGPFS